MTPVFADGNCLHRGGSAAVLIVLPEQPAPALFCAGSLCSVNMPFSPEALERNLILLADEFPGWGAGVEYTVENGNRFQPAIPFRICCPA